MALPIDGPRVRLRRFTSDDVAPLMRLASDPAVAVAIPELGAREQGARAYLKEKARSTDFEPGAVFDLAVEVRETGRIAGLLTLVRRPAEVGALGFALLGEERGKGYATEASRVLLDYAFTTLGLEQVVINTSPGNSPAQGVALRLGLHRIDKEDDLEWFRVTRQGWPVE